MGCQICLGRCDCKPLPPNVPALRKVAQSWGHTRWADVPLGALCVCKDTLAAPDTYNKTFLKVRLPRNDGRSLEWFALNLETFELLSEYDDLRSCHKRVEDIHFEVLRVFHDDQLSLLLANQGGQS